MKVMKIPILIGTILILGLYGCQRAAEKEVGEVPPAEGQEYGWGGEASKELKVAEGQLIRVDQDSKKLAIKKDDGAEMEFSFDDKTEIRGSQTTTQGLASETNAHVTVRYEDGFITDMAKVIEIHAQGSSR
ncbi:MAG: hypothetical protein HYX74_00585 [Acidobacteria bacterium]|nr:hypothetical protein [Acidobacteriota bacterium]